MHRVMRGMFPLQVIRYLRGKCVARRLGKRKGKRRDDGYDRKKDNRIILPNKEALASVTTCLSNDLQSKHIVIA